MNMRQFYLNHLKSNSTVQFEERSTIKEVEQILGFKHMYAYDREGRVLNDGRPLSVMSAGEGDDCGCDCNDDGPPRLDHYPDAIVLVTYREDIDVISKNGRGNDPFYHFTGVTEDNLIDYESASKKSTFVRNLLVKYANENGGVRYFHHHQKQSYPTLHDQYDESDKIYVNTICNKFRGIRTAIKKKASAAAAAPALDDVETATFVPPTLPVDPVTVTTSNSSLTEVRSDERVDNQNQIPFQMVMHTQTYTHTTPVHSAAAPGSGDNLNLTSDSDSDAMIMINGIDGYAFNFDNNSNNLDGFQMDLGVFDGTEENLPSLAGAGYPMDMDVDLQY